jgi:hypothetical protein
MVMRYQSPFYPGSTSIPAMSKGLKDALSELETLRKLNRALYCDLLDEIKEKERLRAKLIELEDLQAKLRIELKLYEAALGFHIEVSK